MHAHQSHVKQSKCTDSEAELAWMQADAPQTRQTLRALKKLRAEGQLQAELAHANVLSACGAVMNENTFSGILMPFLEGGTLAAALRYRPVAPDSALGSTVGSRSCVPATAALQIMAFVCCAVLLVLQGLPAIFYMINVLNNSCSLQLLREVAN